MVVSDMLANVACALLYTEDRFKRSGGDVGFQVMKLYPGNNQFQRFCYIVRRWESKWHRDGPREFNLNIFQVS